MEPGVVGCDQKIEDGHRKTKELDIQIKNMERKIKNERIIDCERTQKVAFELLEKLSRLLGRVKTQINVIEKDQ